MSRRNVPFPAKTSMNLFYKPDRTTKPATAALYILFVLTCLLGLSKPLVYDLLEETGRARQEQAAVEAELAAARSALGDYDQIRERWLRYVPTEEEKALVDRMEVLALLDKAVGPAASKESVSISGDDVRLCFHDATLAQTAPIVRLLEASPLVAEVTASSALSTEETPPGDSAPARVDIMIRLQKEEIPE